MNKLFLINFAVFPEVLRSGYFRPGHQARLSDFSSNNLSGDTSENKFNLLIGCLYHIIGPPSTANCGKAIFSIWIIITVIIILIIIITVSPV